MKTDLSNLYPMLTHSLFLTVFFIIAIGLVSYAYRDNKFLKKTDSWIEISLLALVCAISLGAFFDGENVFSGMISKGVLFLLFFFSTGRIVLLFRKNKGK